MNLLNLNKKIQDKKLEEFKEKSKQCAEELEKICIKYELKLIPFMQMNSYGNSPLIRGIQAEYTFAPMSQNEIELIKLKEQNEAKNTESSPETST